MTTLVMTGASRGLGLVAAQRLLRDDPGLHLYVIARGETIDHPRVTTVRADLSVLADVRAAAAQIPGPVDGFIGNAGVQMTTSQTATADGLETTFAVNILANYLLVRLLSFTPGARIVITGSDSHIGDWRHNMFGIVPGPRWAEPAALARPGKDLGGRRAYSTSKLGVLYLVHELARRMPEAEVYTFNPGLTPGTGLVREDRVGDWLWRRVFPYLPQAITVEEAGRMLAAVSTGDTPAGSGAYVDRDDVVPSSAESYDEARERELWATLEKMV